MRRKQWIILACLFFVSCVILLPGIQQVRDGEAWPFSASNLKQIGIAMHIYREDNGDHPPITFRGEQGKALLSWRVELLPYLEQDFLYRRMKHDEPWDSPHNIALLKERPPPTYCRYWTGGPSKPYQTYYQLFVGPGTAFEKSNLDLTRDFPDGHANTLLGAEATEAVPWSKPVDMTYAPDKPLPAVGGHYNKITRFLHFETGHVAGFNALFADGSVRFLRQDMSEDVLRALITRNGGEKIPKGIEVR